MKQEAGSRKQEAGSIHLILSGRLGNQLFRYAFARALQVKFYPDYIIDININEFTENKNNDETFSNGLKDFNIQEVNYNSEPPRKFINFFQRCLLSFRHRIIEKIFRGKSFIYVDTKFVQPILNKAGVYMPNHALPSGYVKPRRSPLKNLYCQAYFENPKYFDGIRNILLEEFTPRHDVLTHNIKLLDDIKNSESVCVSIRRGDFLSPQYRSRFNVCNEEYFITAMKAIREEISDCKFFVFSDDVEDVKKNFHFPFDVTYEKGDDPVWEKLRLMYNCKHFIISNSTFSWWAHYLSRNNNKIVYAPTPWRRGESCKDFYLPYMRTIEC